MSPEAEFPPTPQMASGPSGPRSWVRNPVTIAVAVEMCFALALVAVAWHLVQAHRVVPQAIISSLPFASAPSPAPIPSLQVPRGAGRARTGSLARLRTDPAFMHSQLSNLNRDQGLWERAEWTVMQAFTQVARAYLERVVVPAVEHASQK